MRERIVELLKSTERKGIDELIAYMDQMNFFDAPCSGKYHLSRVGGLAEHSLNVYEMIKTFAVAIDSDWALENSDSLKIVALLHDLGKMGDHDKSNYVENVLKSGKVSTAEPYKTNKDLLYIPHEIRSIAIAERFINLTEQEEWAILYHNGMYGELKYSFNGKETPLALMLHFADMWCARVTETEEGDEE